MLNCPVCDAKYTEEQEICSSCCWPFNVDFEKITEQITWAKQVWHNQRQSELNSRELEEKHKKLEEKYKELEEKYKELEDNKQQNESLDAQLKVLTSQLSDLTSKHDEDVQFLLNEIKQLKKEQKSAQSQLSTLLQQTQSDIETRLQALEDNLRANKRLNSGSGKTSSTNPNPSINQDIKQPQGPPLSLDESELVTKYNQNRDLSTLLERYVEVSETEDSISSRTLVNSSPVVFEEKKRGNYWILKNEGFGYLVPSKNLRINEHNYKTVEALFQCRGYQPESSSNFQLLKPAKVFPLSGGETWQLEEPGILQF